MADASFDVVSEYDRQEMVNAVDQAHREIGNRYDFKGTDSTLELKDKEITLDADSDYKLGAMIDILQSKMVKRHVDLKVLDPQKVEPAAKGRVRQKLNLRQGLADDLARDVVKRIKAELPKLQLRIEGDKVRVSGKSRDDLQAAQSCSGKPTYRCRSNSPTTAEASVAAGRRCGSGIALKRGTLTPMTETVVEAGEPRGPAPAAPTSTCPTPSPPFACS